MISTFTPPRAAAVRWGAIWRRFPCPARHWPFGVVYAIWRSFIVAGAVAMTLFAASVWSNISFFRKVKRYQRLKTDNMAVEVFEVTAERVVDIEPLGDDAPALCFFAGDRKALLLVGQWLLEYESFPAERFRVHRWRESKECIRIETTGPKIAPEPSKARLRLEYRYSKLELMDAAPDSLQEDLDRSLS